MATATATVSVPRRSASMVLAGITVALPLLLALVAPAEILLPLALALPFGTMIWLERALPRGPVAGGSAAA